uniref:Uncharacterized protein n=1 Tax=Arundo donax TaxID=35708 RepID=A0A0A9HAK9_ARUDO
MFLLPNTLEHHTYTTHVAIMRNSKRTLSSMLNRS